MQIQHAPLTREQIIVQVRMTPTPKRVEVFENGSFRRYECNVGIAFKLAASK